MNISHNAAEERFETDTAAGLAVLEYRRAGTTLALTHTGVPNGAEGRGIGTALVRYAVHYAREHTLQIRPLCPFVAAYLKKHPEDRDVVLDASPNRLS